MLNSQVFIYVIRRQSAYPHEAREGPIRITLLIVNVRQ